MDAPNSFWKLAMRFHQDVLSFVESREPALADYLIRGLLPAERQELAAFLDRTFAMPDHDAVLMRLWSKSLVEFGFASASDLAGFFRLIRRRL